MLLPVKMLAEKMGTIGLIALLLTTTPGLCLDLSPASARKLHWDNNKTLWTTVQVVEEDTVVTVGVTRTGRETAKVWVHDVERKTTDVWEYHAEMGGAMENNTEERDVWEMPAMEMGGTENNTEERDVWEYQVEMGGMENNTEERDVWEMGGMENNTEERDVREMPAMETAQNFSFIGFRPLSINTPTTTTLKTRPLDRGGDELIILHVTRPYRLIVVYLLLLLPGIAFLRLLLKVLQDGFVAKVLPHLRAAYDDRLEVFDHYPRAAYHRLEVSHFFPQTEGIEDLGQDGQANLGQAGQADVDRFLQAWSIEDLGQAEQANVDRFPQVGGIEDLGQAGQANVDRFPLNEEPEEERDGGEEEEFANVHDDESEFDEDESEFDEDESEFDEDEEFQWWVFERLREEAEGNIRWAESIWLWDRERRRKRRSRRRKNEDGRDRRGRREESEDGRKKKKEEEEEKRSGDGSQEEEGEEDEPG